MKGTFSFPGLGKFELKRSTGKIEFLPFQKFLDKVHPPDDS
ncbi:unnamed protein product [Heterosigma akashiwo]